ncbi:hypothetical protein V5799_011942 [Amblyomma americanum]|uniref:Uncharacterized protein n=1 Tax=Amblyomma americanum TaxID=6943 RepID=A0AAQ4EG89_AMBAM
MHRFALCWDCAVFSKKVEVAKPLSDITFKTTDPNGRQGFKRKRSYDPCPNGKPSDAGCFRKKLQNVFPRALWLRYNKEATEQVFFPIVLQIFMQIIT